MIDVFTKRFFLEKQLIKATKNQVDRQRLSQLQKKQPLNNPQSGPHVATHLENKNSTLEPTKQKTLLQRNWKKLSVKLHRKPPGLELLIRTSEISGINELVLCI